MARFTLQRGNDGGMRLLDNGAIVDWAKDEIPLGALLAHLGVDIDIVWGDFDWNDADAVDWYTVTFKR